MPRHSERQSTDSGDGASRDRTGDLLLAKQALSQLSYGPSRPSLGVASRVPAVARVISVNVGTPRAVDTGRRRVSTAIWKHPVEGRVAVRGVNLAGDDQADRTVHGGPDKAVYAYGVSDIRAWEGELGRELGPGAFGE